MAWKQVILMADTVEWQISDSMQSRAPAQNLSAAPRPTPVGQVPCGGPQMPACPNLRLNPACLPDHQGARPGVHPGAGLPMDVDIRNARRNRNCFLCGKPGHFAHKCPDGRTHVWSTLVAMGPIMRALMFEELQHVRETEGEEEEAADEIEEGLAVETVEDFTNGQA